MSLVLSLFFLSFVVVSPVTADSHNNMPDNMPENSNQRIYLLQQIKNVMRQIDKAELAGDNEIKEWAQEQAKMNNVSLGQQGNKIFVEASGEGIWMMPEKRELDPQIFGTPDNPNHIGVLPVNQRMVSDNGTSYTTTKMPGPFSNKIAEIDNGSFDLYAEDNTILDSPDSEDAVEVEAVFYGPKGENEFKVTLDKVLPVGPEHTFFGGVGTDVYIHGNTNIGEPLMPKLWNYTAVWGVGNLYKNGEMIDDSRLIHLMVSQRVRDEEYQLGFDVAMPDELEIHVILPPTKIVDGAPTASPVPTGIMLPNGKQQPFIHVNYYENIEVKGNRFLD